MLDEEIVGYRDHPVVPRAPLAALIAADQQDRGAARVPGLLDRVHERPPESWPSPLEDVDGRGDGLLLLFGEVVPPERKTALRVEVLGN
jgi:hypothetical protein